MDYKSLEFITVLAKEKNITRTAKKLYISQPALTYKIQAIEKELGVKVLYKTKGGVKFTPQGWNLIEYAEKALHDYEKFKVHIKNTDQEDEGIIKLGASRNFSRYMLPGILYEFIYTYSKVQFNVKTSWSQSLLENIKNEELNIAIIRGDFSWNFEKILLNEEPICIVSKDIIDLEKLPYEPRIDFLTDPGLQNVINKWWTENFSTPPNVTMELDNIETCLELVKYGLGYAIIPSIGLQESHNLHYLNLKNENQNLLLRKTWLLYKETDLNYPIISKFIHFLKDRFNDI